MYTKVRYVCFDYLIAWVANINMFTWHMDKYKDTKSLNFYKYIMYN